MVVNKNCFMKLVGKVFSGVNSITSIEKYISGNCAVLCDINVLSSGLCDKLFLSLNKNCNVVSIISDIPPEPSIIDARKTINQIKEYTNLNFIIGIGGGSIIDIVKLSSIAYTSEYTLDDIIYHNIGRKQVRTIIIPTTAGTGAEATPNSIILFPKEQIKFGIINDEMIPDYVFLDPEFLINLPINILASTGIDALTHSIECYISKKSNVFSDTFAEYAVKLIFKNLIMAYENKSDFDAKNNMLIAAHYGGIAITSSGTTAIHALSYPLGGKYRIPHGIANAALMLPVLRYNHDYCVHKYARLYDIVNGPNSINEIDKSVLFLDQISDLISNLNIPCSLAQYGIVQEDLDSLCSAGMGVTRLLSNNPREMTEKAAREIYKQIL